MLKSTCCDSAFSIRRSALTMAAQTDGTQLKESAGARLAAAREEYVREARRGRAGRETALRYADQMDGVVQTVVEAARDRTSLPFAVCAVGGYGRRAQCLHSDVDLLIVFDGAIEEREEAFVKAVLQPLWDLRLELGQHVREFADFSEPDLSNPEYLLSLLDLRYLAGSLSLYGRIALSVAGAHARASLQPLLGLVADRHAQFNDTLYQLEPDIKQSPGGLRDISVIRHLQLLAPAAFADFGDVVSGRIAGAEDFFFRIRSVLHLIGGRDVNQLTHDLQEKVSDVLGCAGTHPHQRVESLMGEYFLRARAVTRALASARRAVRPRQGTPITRIGRQFEITEDGVQFAQPDRARQQPSLWVEAFRIALEHQCPVAESALACIEQNIHRCSADDFVATEGDRLQLRRLFTPRTGLYDRLSEMHDCGLLNRIFPEFAKVHCRVVRDFYHKYTVDEHTLLTIRNVESLLDPSSSTRRRFGSILQELHAPELLTLALLFHDVGKWREADHAQESVRLTQSALDRLELPDEERATIEFLIREHLQMSQVAFRRDAEDPQVASRFAELVGTEEHLKLLCLLTFADVGAVSPDTLTPWKEELLWRVYVDSYNRLTLGYADHLLEGDPAGVSVLIAGRPADITEQELVAFLEGLPRRYLTTFGLGAVYRHVRLARDIKPNQVHTFLENHDEVWELTLVTLDKPFLFSNVSGVLSYFGMDIHRGQAMTTPDGLVLDVFEFSDEEGFLRQNAAATIEISRMLEQVVAGSVDVSSLLKGRERSLKNRHRVRQPPVAHFDNEHSRKFTVLEIVADDAPGLLHRITRVLSAEGCDLHLALIATEGKRAIDVLHVTRAGAKLTEAEQESLARGLTHVLEAGE
jgi:[protein-PII] uridylyltransferase